NSSGARDDAKRRWRVSDLADGFEKHRGNLESGASRMLVTRAEAEARVQGAPGARLEPAPRTGGARLVRAGPGGPRDPYGRAELRAPRDHGKADSRAARGGRAEGPVRGGVARCRRLPA